MSDQKQAVLTFDWALLFYWMMATTSGWLLGWLLLPAIALVTAGVGASMVQGFVLYRRITPAWRWILASAVGWIAGSAIVIPLIPPGMNLLSGLVLGTVAGTAQWILLRNQVQWAGWWILVSTLAWGTGLSLVPPSGQAALPPIVLSGVMASIPTGIALELLLRNPRKTGTEPKEPEVDR
jgi:hypothetical protein